MLRSVLVPQLIRSEYAPCSVSLPCYPFWFLSSSVLCHWYFCDFGRHWISHYLSTSISNCFSCRCFGCRGWNGPTCFLHWCHHYFRRPLWLMWFLPNSSCLLLGFAKQCKVASLRPGLFFTQFVSYFSSYWPATRRKCFRDHVKSWQSLVSPDDFLRLSWSSG